MSTVCVKYYHRRAHDADIDADAAGTHIIIDARLKRLVYTSPARRFARAAVIHKILRVQVARRTRSSSSHEVGKDISMTVAPDG